MECTTPSTFHIHTIYGMYLICANCKEKHPLERRYWVNDEGYIKHTMPGMADKCECEHISHFESEPNKVECHESFLENLNDIEKDGK